MYEIGPESYRVKESVPGIILPMNDLVTRSYKRKNELRVPKKYSDFLSDY
jgi:hypothetical protein